MSQEGRNTKRKRKSFFQQSVKYHKKGIHGKGVRIDDESYEYFLHVLKLMNQEFASEDDKSEFFVPKNELTFELLYSQFPLYSVFQEYLSKTSSVNSREMKFRTPPTRWFLV